MGFCNPVGDLELSLCDRASWRLSKKLPFATALRSERSPGNNL
jgi:hypothetical protein